MLPRSASLMLAAVLVAGGIVVVSSTGVTDALLSSQAELPGATITAGTAALTVTQLTFPKEALYPGLTISGEVTVTNTGDIPLALSASAVSSPASNLSSALVVTVAVGACTDASSPAYTSAVAGSGPLGTTLTMDGEITLCVLITLPGNAPENSQSQKAQPVELIVTGVQN